MHALITVFWISGLARVWCLRTAYVYSRTYILYVATIIAKQEAMSMSNVHEHFKIHILNMHESQEHEL